MPNFLIEYVNLDASGNNYEYIHALTYLDFLSVNNGAIAKHNVLF